MDLQKVIEKKVAQVGEYRTACRWQKTLGNYAGPQALKDPSISWSDSSHVFELPPEADGWFRMSYEVPAQIDGVDISGSPVGLRCFVVSPTEVFIDGERVFHERFWSDFALPEVLITPRATPGQKIEVLVHMQSLPTMDTMGISTSVGIDIEAIENLLFELETFPHELEYCSQFPELERLVAEVRETAQKELLAERPLLELVEVLNGLRARLSPAARYTKNQRVHLVAHAHIDMNWLWDMQDTINVCGRDFSTMLKLMDDFPDFHFSQSQGSVYEIARNHFPEVFTGMQRAATRGNWDITAATWTEGDLNMAAGEALVRHMLLSRRYMEKYFGRHSRVCWEPDTFGHPANTPQLLRKAGITYYYHMRNAEGFPLFFHAENPLYWWEGVDGSRVLAFTSYYGGPTSHWGIAKISRILRQKHNLTDAMFVFGVGDHGGGPSRREIRRAMWLNSLPTMPRILFSSTHAFFDAVMAQQPLNLPVWKGEMNPVFEGCYTSHADIKRNNRHAENRLLEAEAAGALASLDSPPPDAQALEECWRTVCFNQFHDIFDGCAIHTTYELADKQLGEVIDTANRLARQSLEKLSAKIATQQGRSIAVWNLQGFERNDLVELPLGEAESQSFEVKDSQGNAVPCQVFEGKLWFVATNVPPLGYKTYSILAASGEAPQSKVEENNRLYLLQSPQWEVHVEKRSGCIVRVENKKNGRLLLHERDLYEFVSTRSNLFQVDYEIPHHMSAWLIGPIARTEWCVRDAKVSVKASGAVADVLEIEHKVAHSTLRQQMIFHKQLGRIDYLTQVDWQEESGPQKDAPMLRVSFTPELKGRSRVTWDVPFAAIERPADGKEYPAQKWVDVSDEECGFSLLNDSKYGFSAKGNALTITCIRTSYSPDARPDQGHHEFRYALLPHEGSWKKARTEQHATGFNSPLIPVELAPAPEGTLPPQKGWIEVQGNGVLLTSLKKAEDKQALVIRIEETDGAKAAFTIKPAFHVTRCEEIAPTEDRVLASLELKDGTLPGELAPHEVKTVRVYY